MRVLGIDPGTITAGYAVVERDGTRFHAISYGTVRAGRSATFPERLRRIHEGLLAVIEEFRPDEAAIETIFGGKSIRSALHSGEGRGVAVLAVALSGLPMAEYSPAEIKKAVVGHGRAAKVQIQHMARTILALPDVPASADAADALAVAICHCQRRRALRPR
jgi:crossover junction endodeoxyribonuclease RuvC